MIHWLKRTSLSHYLRWRLKHPQTNRDFLLAYLPPGSIGAEIGVNEGDFSQRILDLVRPKEFHLIDPWSLQTSHVYATSHYGERANNSQDRMDRKYGRVVRRFRRAAAAGVVTIHRDSSDRVNRLFSDDFFDWVYIDGDHLYDSVKKDLELYARCVRPGGIIAGDDYEEVGWWEGGVRRAVDEFVRRRDIEVVLLQDNQFILRKMRPVQKVNE